MDWIGLVAGVAALITAFYTRSLVASQREQHAADVQRVETELDLMRASLDEARRQWEESGSDLIIEGAYVSHATDRRADSVTFTIANRGRLRTYVSTITVHQMIFSHSSAALGGEDLPFALDPGQPLKVSTTRGFLVDQGFQFRSDDWWELTYIEVTTGDGRLFRWNKDLGMNPDLARWV